MWTGEKNHIKIVSTIQYSLYNKTWIKMTERRDISACLWSGGEEGWEYGFLLLSVESYTIVL